MHSSFFGVNIKSMRRAGFLLSLDIPRLLTFPLDKTSISISF